MAKMAIRIMAAAIMKVFAESKPNVELLDVGEGEGDNVVVGDEDGEGDRLGEGDGECVGEIVG